MALRRITIPNTVNCPHCRETSPAVEAQCRSCGKPLVVYIGPAEMLPRRVELGSLMIVVAVLAPCLVVLREVPGLGILLLLVVVPALVRTLGAVSTRKSDGRPMVAAEQLGTFAASVAIVWLIGLAALLAAGTVYVMAGVAVEIVGAIVLSEHLRILESEWGFLSLAPVAIIAAVAVIYALGKRLWALKN